MNLFVTHGRFTKASGIIEPILFEGIAIPLSMHKVGTKSI